MNEQALRFRIGLFQRNEFGLLGFRRFGFDLSRRGSRGVRAPAWSDHRRLEHGAAFWAGDGDVVQVIKPRAAMCTQALCTELRLCHGFVILKGR